MCDNDKLNAPELVPQSGTKAKGNSVGETTPQEPKVRDKPRRRRRSSKKSKQGQEECEDGRDLPDEGKDTAPSDSNGLLQKPETGRKPITSNDLKAKISRVKSKLAKLSSKCSKVNDRSSAQSPVDHNPDRKRRTRSERSSSQRGASNSVIKSMSFSSSTSNDKASKNGRSVSECEPGPSWRRSAEDEEDTVAKSVKKRTRQKKASSEKSLWDQFYDRKPENAKGEFVLDSLSFFLLDMLLAPPEKWEQLIAREACNRGILLESNSFWHLNSKILKWHAHPFRSSYANITANYSEKKFAGKRFAAAPPPEEPSAKTFEDLVNTVVLEGLPGEQRKEFAFPVTPSNKRKKNYFNGVDFENKLEAFAQKCVEANLGVIVEEPVRISAKNNHHAYLKVSDSDRDAMISSPLARKFALQGDVVRAFVRNGFADQAQEGEKGDSQPDGQLNLDSQVDEQADADSAPLDDIVQLPEEEPLVVGKSVKAFVIKIVKEVHNRMVVGSFLSCRKNSKSITFVPQDMRLPHVRIFKEFWPESFREGNLDNVCDTLYVAEIIGWHNDLCIGKIVQSIGKCGDLDSENRAILLKNNLQLVPFDEKFNEMYSGEFTIPEEELGRREDLRRECIFTIDPLTAKDLDDALSVKQLPDGNFEVGVHISDVTYFLEEGCELDELVKLRTTTVYLVNEVFHMLPKPLCFRCSLLPDADKLAFSVFWKISPEAEILSTRFARTVIRSCTQFAYQHAQLIIDNPDREFSDMDFPQIHNGFRAADVVRCVKQLESLATVMRKKRFENGALKIDRPKIYFILDPKTGEPVEVKKQEQLEANFLIEEFMLLANQSVAAFIYEKFPSISILRNHEPPLKNVLKRVKDILQKAGMTLDVSSSKSIHNSLKRLIAENGSTEAASVCLSQILSKPLLRAKYFCSNDLEYDKFSHYALSIPIYTHFTSPIRRYPDILVHRLLATALNYTPVPKRTPAELQSLAERCNDDKYSAKRASNDSTDVYFLHYIKSKGSILMVAAVMEIFLNSFDAVLLETGDVISVSLRNQSEVATRVSKETGVCKMYMTYPFSAEEIEVNMCSEVWLRLSVKSNRLKGALAPPPGRNIEKAEEIVKQSNDHSNDNSSNAEAEKVISDEGNSATNDSFADGTANEKTGSVNQSIQSMLVVDETPDAKDNLLETNDSSTNMSEKAMSQSAALARLLVAESHNLTDTTAASNSEELNGTDQSSRSSSVSSDTSSTVSSSTSQTDDSEDTKNQSTNGSDVLAQSTADGGNETLNSPEREDPKNSVTEIMESMKQLSVESTSSCDGTSDLILGTTQVEQTSTHSVEVPTSETGQEVQTSASKSYEK